MKKHTDIIRAIKKNNPVLYNNEGIDNIHMFLTREYYIHSRPRKIIVGEFLRNSEIRYLDEYSYEKAKIFRKQRLCEQAKRGWKNTLLTKTEITSIKKAAAKKYWSKVNSKKEGRSRIIKKGKNIAIEFGIEAQTDNEYLMLSGLKKKLNFNILTEEEKAKKRICWKRKNLQQKTVQQVLTTEYPNFVFIDVSLLHDTEIEEWYFRYCSLRSINRITSDTFKKGIIKVYSRVMNKVFTLRSNLEKMVLYELDKFADNIEVEPFHIKYKRINETASRRYCPDFVISYLGKKYIIEVKPSSLIEEFYKTKAQYINEDIIVLTEKDLKNECVRGHFTK